MQLRPIQNLRQLHEAKFIFYAKYRRLRFRHSFTPVWEKGAHHLGIVGDK